MSATLSASLTFPRIPLPFPPSPPLINVNFLATTNRFCDTFPVSSVQFSKVVLTIHIHYFGVIPTRFQSLSSRLTPTLLYLV